MFFNEFSEKKEGEEEKDVNTKPEEEKPLKPRPLHKTNSIFLRNLAPSITKQEVEAVSLDIYFPHSQRLFCCNSLG